MVDVFDPNLDENLIFISWKQLETKTLVILMQYKNKFVKCRHHKPHFQMQKLVMYSCQQQSFGIIDGKLCWYFSSLLEAFLILVIQVFSGRLHKRIIIY
jgi:hypothetical protein